MPRKQSPDEKPPVAQEPHRSDRNTPQSSFTRQLLQRAASKLSTYVNVREANVADDDTSRSSGFNAANADFNNTADNLPATPAQYKYENPSTESTENRRRANNVDFVLAYNRHRKDAAKKNTHNNMADESERRRFYQKLRANGILVNVDDDPTYSLDAGRTCFALLRLSQQLLECKCHTVGTNISNNSEDEQTVTNTNDVKCTQHFNCNDSDQEVLDKNLFTSAQRTQIVWHIILRIGNQNKRGETVMSLDQLLETGIFTAAYPVHDGKIKLDEGEDPSITNDRRELYEIWARPGMIIPRQWKPDERITALIQRYYGVPVAVYFCWLRYYTLWLVGPAIAGLAWFLYGLLTTRNDVPTHDICDPKSPVANWILCPTRRCDDNVCGFTRVLDTCGLYKWTSAATFDRLGAVVFAIFMAFWATVFQQLWTIFGWQPDETHVSCCPESENHHGRASPSMKHVVGSPAMTTRTLTQPPPPPPRPSQTPFADNLFDRRWYTDKLLFSLRAIAFLATLVAVAAVPILIVVYRGRAIGWLMSSVFHQNNDSARSWTNFVRTDTAATADRRHRRHNFFLLNYTNNGELSNWKTAVAALCATFVQLTAIVAVHRGYSAVAFWLTKHSYSSVYNPRFQSRYIAYMSCFDSANYYSSLVYIAFFKGRFATEHREHINKASGISKFWPISWFRNLIIDIREDVCDPAAAGTGCVPELCIQLAIIMVGKQLIDNVIELTTPLSINIWRRWRARVNRRRKILNGKLPETIVETVKHPRQWQLDYQLEDPGPLGLYQEYSEMVIQYGFVVMFTTAFPLAPLCALLNNILERRLDAFKMVVAQRRPVPAYYCTNENNIIQRKKMFSSTTCCDNCIKLGSWTRVLKILSTISILYNAFMIAFTSDLLPRYVYSQISSELSSPLDGYVAWSLSSKRNMTEYYYGELKDVDRPEICRYKGYGDESESDYRKWQVLAARLTFVIVFEHSIIASMLALSYVIRKMIIKYKNSRTEKFDGEHSSSVDEIVPPTIYYDLPVAGISEFVVTKSSTANDQGRTTIDMNTTDENGKIATEPPVVVVDIENDDRETWKKRI